MREACDLKVHINGHHTFFLNQKIMSTYSGKLRRMIKQEKTTKKTHVKNSVIEVNDLPGGADGFELVSRFCYNNGRISITTSNLPLLHCSAIFLEMTDEISPYNLLQQTESFLRGLFYWSWNDILMCLKNCERLFSFADSSGILEKLISSLITKITQNSDLNLLLPVAPASTSSSSSSSSPETSLNTGFRFSSSNRTTPDHHSSITTPTKFIYTRNAWWFDELCFLPPKIIEKIIMMMGGYKITDHNNNSNNLIITKFILHYLKTAVHNKSCNGSFSKSSSSPLSEYSGLADTAVYGVALMGKTAFSCRGLFWILRLVSDLGLSKSCKVRMEKLIGEMLEQATLDDLLVAGHRSSNSNGGVYDVNFVLRLIRVFVSSDDATVMKMKRVGRLIDKYMAEISPDHNLKVSKFLAVAECLPDCARDCFDGVYRAIDIYLESHKGLSFEERSRICRCLNYEKLSLETCRDLAKNPRIPPKISIQALMSQNSKTQDKGVVAPLGTPSPPPSSKAQVLVDIDDKYSEFSEESEEMKLHIQRMHCRVFELEKVCKEMNGQMSRLIKDNNSKAMISPPHNRAVPRGPRLC